MKTSIDIRKSTTGIISDLLKFEGQTNQNEILYKKTAKAFKKEFGIELEDAPIIFVKHRNIWKLSHITYKSNGRTFESATYHPIVNCADKFRRLETNTIKTVWDQGVKEGFINLQ